MSRLYRAGDTLTKTFKIVNSTGALANADSLPTAALWRNGAADGAVTVTVTNPATGTYKTSCTVPVGYAAGDTVEVHVAATVGGIATGDVVDTVRLVAFDPLSLSLGMFTAQMTEAYAADGVQPTLAQAIYLIMQHLNDARIVSTTKTVFKLDGVTPAATLTLDHSTTPTVISRIG